MFTKLLFFLSFASTVGNACSQDSSDLLRWTPQPISWNDFQENPGYDKYYGKRAKTHWRLSMQIIDSATHTTKQIIVKVQAFLIRSLSWVRPVNRTDNNLLIHEQLHFDMVEWYARQLRKAIREESFSFKNYRTKTKSLHRGIMEKLQAKQSAYDLETRGGNNMIVQNHWSKEIIQGIKRLDRFADTTIVITLR